MNFKKDVSVEDAVRTLRMEIDGGKAYLAAKTARIAGRIVWLGIKFVVWNLLALAILVLWRPGTIVFLAVLGILNLLVFWPYIKQLYELRKAKSGMLLGNSYSRMIEQYANFERDTPRSASRAAIVGSRGPYLIDYANEPNPHVLVVGSTSSGKTTTLRTVVSRASLSYGSHFLMLDWNGENEEWSKKVGAALWKVPLNLKINLFALNGRDPETRASMVEEALITAARLTPLQATKVRNMIMKFYRDGTEPTLQDLVDDLGSEGKKNSLILHRLGTIFRVIGEEPASFWKSIFEQNTVISFTGLNEPEKAVVAYFILQRVCELFEREGNANKERLLVVVDEAWQLLRSSEQLSGHESLAEKVVRVGRKYGFGIVTGTQQLEDVPPVFVNSSALILLHNYKQLQYSKSNLSINPFDAAYLGSANQGECLVFDRLRAQKGQPWQDYVKIRPLSDPEYGKMCEKPLSFSVPVQEQAEIPDFKIRTGVINEATKPQKSPFQIPGGAPSPAEHAAMLGIYYSSNKNKGDIIAYIREKGWIKSPSTIYGYTGKPGILDVVVNSGFASKFKDKYGLTEQGRDWIDPERILRNQSDKLGSEEHKRLLIKTIERLHESNILVITSRIKHSPDLIGWSVNDRKRYLWDTERVRGYEIQTSARKDSIEQNSKKFRRWKIPTVWITNDQKILEEIKKLETNQLN